MAREKPVDIDLEGNGGMIRLHSWAGARRWIDEERERWSFINGSDQAANIGNVKNRIINAFAQLTDLTRQLENQQSPLSGFAHYLTSTYAPDGELIHSSSTLGETILSIASTAGVPAAAFVYGFSKRWFGIAEAARLDHVLGLMLAASPAFQRPDVIGKRLANERANYREAIKAESHRLSEISSDRDREWHELLRKAEKVSKRAFRGRIAAWTRAEENRERTATSSIDEITAVQNTYLEFMRLNAPVQYWADKAATHKAFEKTARMRLVAFFPISALLLAAAFYAAGCLILVEVNTPHPVALPLALYFVISAALVSLSTLVFWAGRMLSKLYLSEHHLRNDAEERAVMTTTYLALTHASAAEPADRQLILGALFRNTPDGIVKDDGPSDMAGLLSAAAKLR